jgi:hypothetical protein
MLIARMGSVVRGQPLSFGAAARVGLRRSPAYIGAALLFGLMVFVAVLVTVFIVAIFGGFVAAVSDSAVATLIVGLVIMLFASIPAVYLSVTFFFYISAAVLGNKGPASSLGYSFPLIRGHWWRTARC